MPGNFWRISFQIMVTALALIVGDYLMDGVQFEARWIALVAALVLSLLNVLLRPVLILLTVPVTLVTFGLFLLVINAVILMLAGEMVPGFHIAGFWSAFWLSLLISAINALLGGNARVVVHRKDDTIDRGGL